MRLFVPGWYGVASVKWLKRIDVITEISGVSHDEALVDGVNGHLGPEVVRCIGLDALIRNKRAAGRAKDLADAETLEELRARR